MDKSKMRWMCIAPLADVEGMPTNRLQALYDLIIFAPIDQIKRLSANARFPLGELLSIVRSLMDFPELPNPHEGLYAYYRRSLEWHAQHRYASNRSLAPDVPLAVPPIQPPDGVIFLKTAGELYLEGELMHHCVGTYARRAHNGECYIFHAEYKDMPVTIEMLPNGHISQVQGPHDHQTEATAHFYRVMNEYGRQFPQFTEVKEDVLDLDFAEMPF
jgi:hypothetical protein